MCRDRGADSVPGLLFTHGQVFLCSSTRCTSQPRLFPIVLPLTSFLKSPWRIRPWFPPPPSPICPNSSSVMRRVEFTEEYALVTSLMCDFLCRCKMWLCLQFKPPCAVTLALHRASAGRQAGRHNCNNASQTLFTIRTQKFRKKCCGATQQTSKLAASSN